MDENTEYLTVKQAQAICQYKWPDTIRRLVYDGTLPATRLRGNRMLIPKKAFWDWFHSFDVKPRQAKKVPLSGNHKISKPGGK